MIRAKCPKCGKPVVVDEAQAGGVGACPHCGQKFRVPGGAKAEPAVKAAPPKPKPATEPVDGGYVVMPAVDVPPPPPRVKERAPIGYRMDEDEQEENDAKDVTEEPKANEDEAPRKIKKKKKKKKQTEDLSQIIPGVKNSYIVLGVLAFFLIGGVTVGGYFIMKRAKFGKPAEDPEVVVAAIKEMNGNVERDPADNAVIGVSLSSSEAKGYMLGRLKAFHKLQKLNLSNTLVADTDMDYMEDLPTLRVLTLSGTKVTGQGVKLLKVLKNLEELNLSNTLVTEDGLYELRVCKNLRKLSLDNSPLANGLSLKAELPNLQVSH